MSTVLFTSLWELVNLDGIIWTKVEILNWLWRHSCCLQQTQVNSTESTSSANCWLIIKLMHESVMSVYTISADIKQHHESILSFKTFHIILWWLFTKNTDKQLSITMLCWFLSDLQKLWQLMMIFIRWYSSKVVSYLYSAPLDTLVICFLEIWKRYIYIVSLF